ncbi:MAG: DNA polymerase III subunit delta [Clostridia bacterium]|nr:DNA polymerase III subunit delta [Clostridia bacterium]
MSRPLIKEEDFRKQTKTGLSGAYLFFGPEDYLKSLSIRAVRSSVLQDPSLAAFNEFKLKSSPFNRDDLQNAIAGFPMMSEQKLITLENFRPDDYKKEEMDGLLDCLKDAAAYPFNVILLSCPASVYESYNPLKNQQNNKPPESFRLLTEYATPVYFPLVTDAKLVNWVGRHFAHNGVQVTPAFCRALIGHCGESMMVLANEVDKLSWYALSHPQSQLTTAEIGLLCGANKDYDTFDLSNALLRRNYAAALELLQKMEFNREDPVNVLGQVNAIFADLLQVKALADEGKTQAEIESILGMHSYRASLYLRSCSQVSLDQLRNLMRLGIEADAKMKTGGKSFAPIEEFICLL